MKVSVEKPGTPKELVHFGIKGQKWGVRKQRSAKTPLMGLVKKPIVAKTANGDTFTLSPQPPGIISKGLAKVSKNYKKGFETSSYLNIKDKRGKTIGNFQIISKSKDELNLSWIEVDDSARGRGYATAVTKEAIKFAKQQGKKKITLEAVGNSPGGSIHRMAKNLGFKVTKEADPGDLENDLAWGGLTEMELKIK